MPPTANIGHVEDFVVDDENWAIRFLVVATRNWLPWKIVSRSILPNPSAGFTKRFFLDHFGQSM